LPILVSFFGGFFAIANSWLSIDAGKAGSEYRVSAGHLERWRYQPVQYKSEAQKEVPMPRGDKSSYTGKQKRMAQHIEDGYEKRGIAEDEAERRAWAPRRRGIGPQGRHGTFCVREEGRSHAQETRGIGVDHCPDSYAGSLCGVGNAEKTRGLHRGADVCVNFLHNRSLLSYVRIV
jgi:hypothetical protein